MAIQKYVYALETISKEDFMRYLVLLLALLFSGQAFADLVLSTTAESGASADYWFITHQHVSVDQSVGSNDLEVTVVLSLFVSKAVYDAGNEPVGQIRFIWKDADLSSYTSVDLSDDGPAVMTKAYDKIKTLNSAAFNGGTLDFTTATEP